MSIQSDLERRMSEELESYGSVGHGGANAQREEVTAEQEDADRGPHGWLNWQAMRAGLSPRSSSRAASSGLVLPLWQEFGLYSDSTFTGDLELGPYRLLLAFSARQPRVGRVQLELVLRVEDHLLDPSNEPIDLEEQDVAAYAGGDIADEFASLLSLALARRVRSGGAMRHGYERDPKGMPFFPDHHPPVLVPPRRGPVLPGISGTGELAEAEPFLQRYAELDGAHALGLLRAAHQYADALWWADADPRIAWIKLFGALEAAADLWDAGMQPDTVAQLKRRHHRLHRRLEADAPAAIPVVADSLSRILGAESKLIDFVLSHPPAPPTTRPALGRLNFDDLEPSLHILYDHRSRDLHAGIPFPEPLCRPPLSGNDNVAVETFPALGASSAGGSWPASRLPMYLHTFVHIVGEVLRQWWLESGSSGPAGED